MSARAEDFERGSGDLAAAAPLSDVVDDRTRARRLDPNAVALFENAAALSHRRSAVFGRWLVMKSPARRRPSLRRSLHAELWYARSHIRS